MQFIVKVIGTLCMKRQTIFFQGGLFIDAVIIAEYSAEHLGDW
jgi:hypothetical protein